LKLRVIKAGNVSPLYSQAIYHGIAEQMRVDDEPVLVILQPTKPYICIGLHQHLEAEVDIDFCKENNIPVLRRHVGGGTVLLDENQVFFQYIFPKAKAPNQAKLLYPFLLQPVLQTYQHFGIAASLKSLNDIQANNQKIGGTGAGTINNATVLVGSFLYDFAYRLMSQCIKSPSESFARGLETLLKQQITTINSLLPGPPSVVELINIYLKNIPDSLNVDIEESTLTTRETDAIYEAEEDLMDEEWLKIDGKKLVSNGLKIAAGIYLLEQTLPFCGSPLNIRIKFEEKAIHTTWLKSEKPALQESLNTICKSMNIIKPSVAYDDIHEITLKAVSQLNVFSVTEIENLARAIFELADFSEY